MPVIAQQMLAPIRDLLGDIPSTLRLFLLTQGYTPAVNYVICFAHNLGGEDPHILGSTNSLVEECNIDDAVSIARRLVCLRAPTSSFAGGSDPVSG